MNQLSPAPATAPYSLQISAPKADFSPGEEVKIAVTLTNTSTHEIVVRKDKAPDHAEFDYQVVVLDETDQSAPKTKYHRLLSKEEDPGTTVFIDSGGNFTLKPGETLTENLVLNRLFDLSMPGKYKVQAQRETLVGIIPQGKTLRDVAGPPVKSNVLTINIGR